MENEMHRRRFFRRAGVLAALGGVAAAVGTGAFAHGGWRHGGPLTEGHVERMLQHLYIEIDATTEQKQRLGPIFKAAARELAPLHERFHAGRAQAIALFTEERIDPNAIEALRAEQLRLADEGSRRIMRALAEAAEVLSPAQRKGLAERWARRRHRGG